MECLSNYTNTDTHLTLRNVGAFFSKRKGNVDPGNQFVVSLVFFLIIISENLRISRRNTLDARKCKKLEPVSSTSRRGARAAYHDEYPRDFGPRIAYTVSSSVRYQPAPDPVSAPDQAGRERNVGS